MGQTGYHCQSVEQVRSERDYSRAGKQQRQSEQEGRSEQQGQSDQQGQSEQQGRSESRDGMRR